MRHGLRALAFWALLAPFLLLSLLPSSAMPARAADGTLTMVLCTGDGPVEMAMDLATGQPVKPQPAKPPPEGKADHCDWASGQFTADLTAAPSAVLALTLVSPRPQRPHRPHFWRMPLPPACHPRQDHPRRLTFPAIETSDSRIIR